MKRTLPQNVEAEEAVIGAILFSGRCIDQVVELLRPEDFYDPALQAIYEAMLALAAASQPIDLITVAAQMRAADTMGKIWGRGGEAFLAVECRHCISRDGAGPVDGEGVVDGGGGVPHPEAGGGVGLGVEIDHQHASSRLRGRRRQPEGDGGLAHSALLVGDREHRHGCNGTNHAIGARGTRRTAGRGRCHDRR